MPAPSDVEGSKVERGALPAVPAVSNVERSEVELSNGRGHSVCLRLPFILPAANELFHVRFFPPIFMPPHFSARFLPVVRIQNRPPKNLSLGRSKTCDPTFYFFD
jgi:hypothetical protein